MKTIAFALLMLVASTTAFSQVSPSDLRDEKWDLGQIILNAIEKLAQRIKNRGLDPFEIDSAKVEYVLISPSFLSARAYIDNFKFSGLSDIHVIDIGYSLLSNKLHFYIRLPELRAIVGNSGVEANFVSRGVSAKLSGSFAVKGLGIAGEATVARASNSQITVADVSVSAKLTSIESNLNVNIMGLNISNFINNWFTNLPTNIRIYEDIINTVVARIIKIIINRIL